MLSKEKFSIVIPTYKEEEVIGKTIKEVKKHYPSSLIIVVDDSPDDKTKEEAVKNGAFVIKNRIKEGLSGSILKGLKKAETEKIIVMDADLQHPVEKIKDILALLEKYDFVIAERKTANKLLLRNLYSSIAILLGNLSLFLRGKKPLRDPVSGFFGIKRELLKKIDEKRVVKKGWKIAFDIAKQVKEVGRVEYSTLNLRKAGKSKYNLKAIFYYLISLIT